MEASQQSSINEKKIIDLKLIASKCSNILYNPKRFPAVVMRKKDPKTTALIFDTGKMIVTGAKDIEKANTAAIKYTKDIEKAVNKKLTIFEFKVSNIVASCSLPFNVELNDLNNDDDYGRFTTHDEHFPGLIFRVEHPAKMAALIFYSGKLVFTGAKDKEALNTAFKNLYAVCERFKRNKGEAKRWTPRPYCLLDDHLVPFLNCRVCNLYVY